jgi:alpha/beta superfamily hydrolase
MVEAFDILEESVLIDGQASRISAVLAYPLAGAERGAVLVAGPHPLMGGGLENNVVCGVARGLAEHGFVSLRFAYGGQGASQETMREFWQTGHAPEDPFRAIEARDALTCLRSVCPGPIVLVGYSFGASLIGGLLQEPPPDRLVLIGPTLLQHPFDAIQTSPIPKLIITADNDFATPLDHTRNWFAIARSEKKLVIIESGEHFYRGLEDRLVAEIAQWL